VRADAGITNEDAAERTCCRTPDRQPRAAARNSYACGQWQKGPTSTTQGGRLKSDAVTNLQPSRVVAGETLRTLSGAGGRRVSAPRSSVLLVLDDAGQQTYVFRPSRTLVPTERAHADPELNAIACASGPVLDCTAVGDLSDADGGFSVTLTGDGIVDQQPILSDDEPAAVACPSTSSCLAAGFSVERGSQETTTDTPSIEPAPRPKPQSPSPERFNGADGA
jgi:hypothetical protein